MSLIRSRALLGASGAASAYLIDGGGQFEAANTDNMTWAVGSAADSDKVFSGSAWVQDTDPETNKIIISGWTDANNYTRIGFLNGNIDLRVRTSGVNRCHLISNRELRDPSGIYFVEWNYNSTEAVPDADDIYVKINGVKITSFSTETYPSQNQTHHIGQNGITTYIGSQGTAGNYWDGTIHELIHRDGIALASLSEDDDNNYLMPVDPSGTSFGSNGFHLKILNGAEGTDSSGNGNNFTNSGVTGVNNSPTNDASNDVGLFAALSNIDGKASVSNAGRHYDVSVSGMVMTTLCMKEKTYAEITFDASATNSGMMIGVIQAGTNSTRASDTGTGYGYLKGGDLRTLGGSDAAFGNSYDETHTIGVAYDPDTGKFWFSKDNVWQNSGDPANGTNEAGTLAGDVQMFLQCPNTDTHHFIFNPGDTAFAYTPPSGFEPFCTAHFPTPDVLDPTQHYHSAVVSHTTGSTTTVSVPWDTSVYDTMARVKATDGGGGGWFVFDTIAGNVESIRWDTAGVEYDFADGGWSGGDFLISGDFGTKNYLVEFHKAGLIASRSTSNSGTISDTGFTRSTNTDSGFSIVHHQGDGNDNATIDHGFSGAPDVIWSAEEDGAGISYRPMYHSFSFVSAANPGVLYTNTTGGRAADTNVWGSSAAIGSTTFTVGTYDGTNKSGGNYRKYIWKNSDVYKAYEYPANGNADGPVTYVGGEPNTNWLKDSSGGGFDWWLTSRALQDYNDGVAPRLPMNGTAAKTESGDIMDFSSTGFKIRSTTTAWNNSPNTVYGFAAGIRPISDGSAAQARAV